MSDAPRACPRTGEMIELLDAASARTEELRAHAAACPDCSAERAALERTFDQLGRTIDSEVSDETLGRIEAAVLAEPWPPRPARAAAIDPEALARSRRWRALMAGGIGVGVLVVATARLGLRHDIRYLSYVERMGPPALLTALYLAGMAALFLRRRLWGAFLVLAVAAALGVGATEPGLHATPVFLRSGCLSAGIAVGLAPLACAFFLARGRVDGGGLAGVVLGAASGLLGMAVLHLHCAVGNAGHGLVGHAGVTFALMLLGGYAGERVLRPATPRTLAA